MLKISLKSDHSMEEVFKHILGRINATGIEFQGDLNSGKFKHKISIGNIKGEYRIMSGTTGSFYSFVLSVPIPFAKDVLFTLKKDGNIYTIEVTQKPGFVSENQIKDAILELIADDDYFELA